MNKHGAIDGMVEPENIDSGIEISNWALVLAALIILLFIFGQMK
jgi:hypothetical protein